ncbi:hypothetical protein Tco_0281291 [Tanacetum coccineum]
MGRDTIQLEDAVSTISQEYLLEFSSEYFILENLHPELPGPGDHIVDFPEGKIGVYTKKFKFANFRILISQFLFDIIGYYQIHLSQVSVIARGQEKNTPQCYTKPLDSLKNWNNRFFWVDEKVFPAIMAWRTAATKDDKPQANTNSVVDVATLDTHQMDLFNLIKAPNPTKVKTGTHQRAAHEGVDTGVHGSAAAEQEIPVTDDAGATEATVEPNLEKEMISMGPTIRKRRRQRDAGEEGSKAPAKVLRKDHDAARAEHSARGGKSLAGMSVDTGLAIHAQKTQEPPIATQTVNDPNPLSYAKPRSQQDVTQSSKEKGIAGDQDSDRSTPSPPITESLGSIYQLGWDVPNSCRLDTPEACQDVVDHIAPPGLRFEQEAKLLKKSVALVARRDQRIATREKHIKDLEAQLEAEINMKKSTEVKNSEVTKELEDLRMRFSGLEVGNAQLCQQVSVLQAQVMGEKRIMAAFEEFKKHEDERMNARCAEINARLDALSVDFDEELYPHMLTAIAGRRWVIGHELRLAVMKCAESTEISQAFANVVSSGIAKGMSEGLKYGVEHGKAGLELTAVEAYDPEADNKYVAALYNLKDLSYPLIDELEQLKDAPLDVIMASLYLESDIDEILVGDAIAANISRVEKKKKSRVVCRTHGVGSAHHARSDGIPVSVPTVAPQGLQILLADAATQTEDEESPRLLRSKSLPTLFTLDLP